MVRPTIARTPAIATPAILRPVAPRRANHSSSEAGWSFATDAPARATPATSVDEATGRTTPSSSSPYTAGNHTSRLPNRTAIANGNANGATATTGKTTAVERPDHPERRAIATQTAAIAAVAPA